MRLLVITSLMLLCMSLTAQADLWRTSDGLSNDWISDIIQDKDGYLWLATQYGVNQFDGYDFETYNFQPNDLNSISSNWVRHLAISGGGDIYLNCFHGQMHRFNAHENSFTILKFDEDDGDYNVIRGLDFDANDNLWVGSDKGLFLLDESQSKLLLKHDAEIKDLSRSVDGSMLVLSEKALYQINESKLKFLTEFPSESQLDQLFVDHKGELWGINSIGFWQVDQLTWDLKAIPLDDFKSTGVFHETDILEDKSGRLWISGNRGVNILSENRKELSYLHLNDLISEELDPIVITKLFQDRNENIWIGTNKGLIMTSALHRRFQHSPDFESIGRIKRARAIHAHDSRIWLGTEEGLYEVDTSTIERPATKIFNKIVTCILYASDGALYIGSDDGLYVRAKENDNFEKLQLLDLEGNLSWDILEDLEGYIWLPSKSGLSRYDPARSTIVRFKAKDHKDLKSEISMNLILDKQGQIWGGSLCDGVYQLTNTYGFSTAESAVFKNYNFNPLDSNSLSNNLIQSMTLSHDGSVWVGTDGGLNRIDADGNIKKYLKKDGLIDDKFMRLLVDDSNILWGSTIGHGVMALDITTEEFQYFSKEDGLSSNNFLLNSGFLLDDGLLLLGSDSKTQIINTNTVFEVSRAAASFSFSDISYLSGETGKSLKNLEQLIIPFGQNSFNISFSTLQFFKANKTKYAYRILPIQEDWQDNGSSRSINFNGLSSGHYTLEVKATNPILEMQDDTIQLDIKILPPWWRTWWAYLCYGLLIIGALHYFVSRQRERVEVIKQKELNDLKTKLYTNITHEIRTPLTVILGLSKKLMNASTKSVASTSDIINRNGNHLLLLVNRILDLSKIESGKMPVVLVRKDLVNYFSYLLESFHSWADEKDIRIHFLPNVDDLIVDIDQEIIKQITNNLLSNAIKNTQIGGDIYCKLQVQAQSYVFEVKDNGRGIDINSLPRLFERFYQTEAGLNSSGLGLAVTKELTELLGGSIQAENNASRGASFRITIPITASAPLIESGKSVSEANDISVLNDDLYQLLIIEDNADVQNFIVDTLTGHFKLNTASNGIEGSKRALELMPDLIICDVMMPGMSGYEVCKQLKSDNQTNHIPIILLTAKADQESKLKGLELGADDFLTKPFDEQELELRINNILASRQILQDRYRIALQEGKELSPHSIDPFIKHVIEIVDKHINDAQFGITRLCKELGISRVHLHRKLKALTNESTSVFIRNIRLTRAKKMLLGTNKNVSEVAYDVGFSDPSYFSKAFTERFGYPPSKERESTLR